MEIIYHNLLWHVLSEKTCLFWLTASVKENWIYLCLMEKLEKWSCNSVKYCVPVEGCKDCQ